MNDVPLEVIEILSRLPVKSLLRCRSVSKAWCALIDSCYFVNFHLNRSKKTHKILTFCTGFGPFIPLYSYYSLYWDSGPSVTKLETPFDIIGCFDEVVGSCNGLICLSRGALNRETVLWNPSTRKYKVIPAPIYYPHRFAVTSIIDRVGYDHLNDDYKVVRLLQYRRSNITSFHSKVIVYSLKLNMWQSVEQDFPYYVCTYLLNAPMTHGQSVDGAIHWIATDVDPDIIYIIVSFNLASHRCQLVPQPEYFKNYRQIDLGKLGECLCLIGHDKTYDVDIWMMEKYGVKESWRKLVTLTYIDVKNDVLPSVQPIVYLENGKKLLLELRHEWLLVYDLEKKKSKHEKIRGGYSLSTYVYNQSLV